MARLSPIVAVMTLAALATQPALANGMGGGMGGGAPVATNSAPSSPSTGGTIDIAPPAGSQSGGTSQLGMPPQGQPRPVDAHGPTTFMGPAPHRPTTFMGPDDGSAARRRQAMDEVSDTIDYIRNGSIGTAVTAIASSDPAAVRAAYGADQLLLAGGGLAMAGGGLGGNRPTVPVQPQRGSGGNGNHLNSVTPQHVYEIFNTRTGDTHKYGISGRPLNENGTSPRANRQVNKLNDQFPAQPGDPPTYSAQILASDLPNRRTALSFEQYLVNAARNTTGQAPGGNQLPHPNDNFGPGAR